MYDIKYLNKEKTTYTEVKCAEEEDGVHVVPIIKFESYRNEKWLTHGFSTRLGGFSSGIYSSMNLSFSQGDDERFVRKNHYLMADAFGVKPDNIVYSHQTHIQSVQQPLYSLCRQYHVFHC
jgi:polyphenol oxidase